MALFARLGWRGLTGNQLKIIAAVLMVIDHVGFYLVSPLDPAHDVLRAIGRLSFPMFAFFIAEGCYYTKNKLKHLTLMSVCAVIAEIVFSVARNAGMNVPYMSIFTTFTLGIVAAYIYKDYCDSVSEGDSGMAAVKMGALAAFVLTAAYIDFYVTSYEYGIGGVLIILFCYAVRQWQLRTVGYATGCLVTTLTAANVGLQSFMFLSTPLLLLYNGKRGRLRMKYFFYIFYPGHIIVILLVGLTFGIL